MSLNMTAGTRLRQAMSEESPLQIAGTINALCALMAESAGFRAIYLSGAGVANASFGMPDLGVTTMNDVVADIERISERCSLPLLVDADTGWGHALSIRRTVNGLIRAGAAGMHIEDQQSAKRCGHRPGKALVEAAEMVDRIHAAVDARTDPDFLIMARTDALASEGMDSAIERSHRYVEAGADAIFAEAVTEPQQYRTFTSELKVPVLANMTEFGKSPLLTVAELADLGIAMILYPLSAFRAMNAAAEKVYNAIRKSGSQRECLDSMQTRDRLYEVLDYHYYEQKIDELIKKSTL